MKLQINELNYIVGTIKCRPLDEGTRKKNINFFDVGRNL